MYNIVQLTKKDKSYQYLTNKYLDDLGFKIIFAIGNLNLLKNKKTAVFCSVKCPGQNILQAYDYCKTLREAGKTIIGGFTSPIEKDCLDILLRGKQPIIICPARALEGIRIPVSWRKHIENGRLLIISPFNPGNRRITAKLAQKRNRFSPHCPFFQDLSIECDG